MSNTAAIDGFTGPGRRTISVHAEIQEVTFRLGKKVVEIVFKDGSMGQYDLAQISSIQASTDGTDFTIAVVSKDEEKDDRTKQARGTAETGATKASTTTPVKG